MQKLIIPLFLLMSLSLTGCHLFTVYQPDIQQGNLFTPAKVQQLKVGMNRDQVQDILGTPVLTNTFSDNPWYYVYTYKPNGGKTIESHLTVYFENDRLTHFTQS